MKHGPKQFSSGHAKSAKADEPNRFEILTVEPDFLMDDVQFPIVSVASTSKPVVQRKPKYHGKSPPDKELDKMVREIQSNRIKVNLSKQMQANLDSPDDPIPTLDKSESPISDASNSSQNQTSAVKPIDNVLAVVHQLTKIKGQEEFDI